MYTHISKCININTNIKVAHLILYTYIHIHMHTHSLKRMQPMSESCDNANTEISQHAGVFKLDIIYGRSLNCSPCQIHTFCQDSTNVANLSPFLPALLYHLPDGFYLPVHGQGQECHAIFLFFVPAAAHGNILQAPAKLLCQLLHHQFLHRQPANSGIQLQQQRIHFQKQSSNLTL